MPVLRSKVDEEEIAAAEEAERVRREQEVLRRLEDERKAREDKEEKLETARRADRERRESELAAAFDAEEISFDEYAAALRALEGDSTLRSLDDDPPSTEPSSLASEVVKDTESEVSSSLGSRSAAKRKMSLGKAAEGSNDTRVRSY
jgi:hypothetical protein